MGSKQEVISKVEVWQIDEEWRILRKKVTSDLPIQHIIERSHTTDSLGVPIWEHHCQWPEPPNDHKFIEEQFVFPAILANYIIEHNEPTRIVEVKD